MRTLSIIIGFALILGSASVSLAQDAKKPQGPSCPEQLQMVSALAKEYDATRDSAIREKVAYKSAYEAEKKARQALEAQLAAIKKNLPAEPVAPKVEEKKVE